MSIRILFLSLKFRALEQSEAQILNLKKGFLCDQNSDQLDLEPYKKIIGSNRLTETEAEKPKTRARAARKRDFLKDHHEMKFLLNPPEDLNPRKTTNKL